MLPPIQFVLPLRASTCLLVAGCKSKSRKPSGPPTFQAVLTILGSGPADNPTVARQLQGRAGALDTFLETKAGSAADKIVVFLYQDTEGEVFKKLIAQYNQDHPDVKVNELYSSNDLVLQKVLTAVRGGSAPDVAYMFGSWSPNIAQIPQVVDMAEYVSEPDWQWDDFYPAEREAATVGEKIVGVPALVDNLAIVYNKQLFAEAGVAPPSPDWTWADFRAAAAKLTAIPITIAARATPANFMYTWRCLRRRSTVDFPTSLSRHWGLSWRIRRNSLSICRTRLWGPAKRRLDSTFAYTA